MRDRLRSRVAPFLLAGLSSVALPACVEEFDAGVRQPEAKNQTLGEEIYTVLCDRVGASSLAEDIQARSYWTICHRTKEGWVGTEVDTSKLPPVSGVDAENRKLAVAKLEAMARNRADLIDAFDQLFPDKEIADPYAPSDDSKKVKFSHALDVLTKRVTPLYESNPHGIAADLPPLLPAHTRSIARFFGALASSSEAQQALSNIGSRQGYRPLGRTLGALKPVFAYPKFREFTKLSIDRIGPGGKFETQFQRLLAVIEQELKVWKPDAAEPAYTVSADKLQPNRRRQTLELASTLLLAENSVYAASGAAPHYLAKRDGRGFVIPAGNGISAPFADKDGDGLADVDALGRFLDDNGNAFLAPPPFEVPLVKYDSGFSFDSSTSRAQQGSSLLYQYRDLNQTFLSSLLRDAQPLVAAQTINSEPSPSTVMKLLEGSYHLFGEKTEREFTYKLADGSEVKIPYSSFNADTSPLLDLTYAVGQFLGARESDDYLGSVMELHEKHEKTIARALSLAWSIWEKSKETQFNKAVLRDQDGFWDDMTNWLVKVARVDAQYLTGTNPNPQGLLADVTLALAHPDSLKHTPKTLADAFTHKDRVNYNSNDINGPPLNYTSGKVMDANGAFISKVDRNQAPTGDNRSLFQRMARMIAGSNHVNTCNRQGAELSLDLDFCGIPIPSFILNLLTDPYDECKLFKVNDLGVFFVDSLLRYDHPRRAILKIEDEGLVNLTGILTAITNLPLINQLCQSLTIDTMLENGTGIRGLNTKPSAQALSRLVFFGAESQAFGSNVSDLDSNINSGPGEIINKFAKGSINPVGSGACPQNSNGVNTCTDFKDTLRGLSGASTWFQVETPYVEKQGPNCVGPYCNYPTSGFVEGLRPVLTAFANYTYPKPAGDKCTADPSTNRCHGEQLFLDLISILDKHWPEGNDSSRLHAYEEFMAWIFTESDLFGTVEELVPILDAQRWKSNRVVGGQERTGMEVTSSLIRFLMDPEVAAANQITTRQGQKSTKFNDGSTKPQVTPYDLFVHSLRGFDARFATLGSEGDGTRKRWKEARSTLVDQFLWAKNGTWSNQSIKTVLPFVTLLTREQINAHCPNRETNGQCKWARFELYTKLKDVMEGPLFGAIMEFQEAIRSDPETRKSLEDFISYLIASSDSQEGLANTITSVVDLLQVLADDSHLVPVFQALSVGATPGQVVGDAGNVTKPGLGAETVRLMKSLLDERTDLPEEEAKAAVYDRYHVLDHVMQNMVKTPAPGKRTPLEVVIDVISEIHRLDSESSDTFGEGDYAAMAAGIERFLADDYRGLEQFYTIVQGRYINRPEGQ